MAFFIIAGLIIYTVIAAGAMALTFLEFLSQKDRSPFFFALGLMGCLFWPATFVIVTVATMLQPAPVLTDTIELV